MSRMFKISLLCLVLLGLLASWLAFGDRGLIYVYNKDKEREQYLAKIEELKKANQELMDEIDRLKNDNDYIEETARKELGMVRDGEVIYMFTGENNEIDAPEQETAPRVNR
ncbi:MAG: septum formation initiator family protein [Deltaproteobacteria bacterium]|nr:septum formation initiator family protein [Deltaproteobacteria bacterium]